MDLEFNVTTEENCSRVAVTGEIDLYSVKLLKEKITILLDGRKVTNLLLDLTGVNYIDSTGLGILIGIKRRCTEKGGRMILVSGSDRITNLFSITGLNKIFTICKTVEEAVADLNNEGA